MLTGGMLGIEAGSLGKTASGQNADASQEQTAAAEKKDFAEEKDVVEHTTAQVQGEKVERTTIEAEELEEFLEDLAYQDLNNFWPQNFAYFAQTTVAEDQYSGSDGSGESISKIIEELGVSTESLRRWVK
jgi:hypothetical protein